MSLWSLLPFIVIGLMLSCTTKAQQTQVLDTPTVVSPTPVVIEVTRIVQQTVVVTQIVREVVTATPLPTPIPSLTPTITPTPKFQKWNTSQVVNKFHDSGLEVESSKPMTKADYGFAPMSAIEAIRFLIPSLCSDCGGRIFSFASEEDLNITRYYYEALGKSSAALYSWVFVKDNILVQINGDLPEGKAKAYKQSLDALK